VCIRPQAFKGLQAYRDGGHNWLIPAFNFFSFLLMSLPKWEEMGDSHLPAVNQSMLLCLDSERTMNEGKNKMISRRMNMRQIYKEYNTLFVVFFFQ
jgi:hypothetical protein